MNNKKKPLLVLVTPGLAAANNGNWQTAARWARWLAADYRVRLATEWHDGDEAVMVALHAAKSAPAIAAFAAAHPTRPLVVVLTGTDLYRDLATEPAVWRSLDLAWCIVVLHEAAVADLPVAWRARCRVCLQSAPARRALAKPTGRLRVLMVGHLRDEKLPQTLFAAAAHLTDRPDIHIDHIGRALDPRLGAQAQETAAACPRYRWLGELPHDAVRRRIQRVHLLVHTSRIEGGAHVVIEALQSGTPVLASRIAGNIGLLGAGYGGYFDVGDDAALATLIRQARDEPTMLPALQRQCALRAPLFEQARERATLRDLLTTLKEPRR